MRRSAAGGHATAQDTRCQDKKKAIDLALEVHVYIQILPTLGPKVYKYYLHWGIWILRVGLRANPTPKLFWI